MLAWNYVFALCMICFIIGFFVCGAVFYHMYKCSHDYEKILEITKGNTDYVIVYRCKKCGKIQKVKVW